MKDHIRDYATEAYRYYARMGCPTYEELRRAIYNKALQSAKKELLKTPGVSDPTAEAIIRAEKEVDLFASQLDDILAVEKAIRLMLPKHPEWLRAVEIVYFTKADAQLEPGDIIGRVNMAAIEIPAGERTVYRWLKQARTLFARERGLRLAS